MAIMKQLLFIGLSILLSGHASAQQKKPKAQELDTLLNINSVTQENSRKIDEILTILTQGYDLKNHSDSIFNLRVGELTSKHKKEIESLNTKLNRSEKSFEQKKEQLQKAEQEFSIYRNTSKEDFEKVINQVFSTSTSIGLDGVRSYFDIAAIYCPELTDPINDFIIVFKEVEHINAEFQKFADIDAFYDMVTSTFASTNKYPGLKLEIETIYNSLHNYCEKESDFIKLLAKAKTQSKIENYKEILKRDESKYMMYPNLSAALENALMNKNFVFKPSCQENRSK
jgi:hypothetical protein